MKKNRPIYLSIYLCLIAGLVSCSNDLVMPGTGEPGEALNGGYTPTVTYHKTPSGEMESYQADVVTYTSNNRRADSGKEFGRYRLSMKNIDGQIYSRIDYGSSWFGDGKARSYLKNGKEMLRILSESNTVESRTPLEYSGSTGSDISQNRLPMGRIGLTGMKAEFQRLSLDMTEDVSQSQLKVFLPLSQRSTDGSEVKSNVLRFDTDMDTFTGYDTVAVEADGTVVKIHNDNFYTDVEGEPVLIANVVSITYDEQFPVDNTGNEVPSIASADDVKEITPAELEALKANGAKVLEISPVIGDPTDPDHTDTTMEVYTDVKVNTVDDSYFRIGF